MRHRPEFEQQEERPPYHDREPKPRRTETRYQEDEYDDDNRARASKSKYRPSQSSRQGRYQHYKSNVDRLRFNRQVEEDLRDTFDESVEVVKSRSHPDDIIEIEERYITEECYMSTERTSGSLSEVFSSIPDSRDDDGWTEDARDTSSSEDSVVSPSSTASSIEDDCNREQEEYCDKKAVHSHKKKEQERFKDPLDQLMSQFQISGLVKRFQQAGSLKKLLEADSSDSNNSTKEGKRQRQQQSRSQQKVKKELKRETRLTDKLERKLKEKQDQFSTMLAAKNQKLATLESKLRLQEQLFESQLEAEREIWMKSEIHVKSIEISTLEKTIKELENQALQSKEANSCLHNEYEIEKKEAHQKAEALEGALFKMEAVLVEQQGTIQKLEKKTKELNQANFWLMQQNETLKGKAQEKIEALEDALIKLETELDEQQARNMKLQVERNRDLFLFEIHKRKMSMLEKSETRITMELLVEQKRSQHLKQMIKKLKASLRKNATHTCKPSDEKSDLAIATPLSTVNESDECQETLDGSLKQERLDTTTREDNHDEQLSIKENTEMTDFSLKASVESTKVEESHEEHTSIERNEDDSLEQCQNNEHQTLEEIQDVESPQKITLDKNVENKPSIDEASPCPVERSLNQEDEHQPLVKETIDIAHEENIKVTSDEDQLLIKKENTNNANKERIIVTSEGNDELQPLIGSDLMPEDAHQPLVEEPIDDALGEHVKVTTLEANNENQSLIKDTDYAIEERTNVTCEDKEERQPLTEETNDDSLEVGLEATPLDKDNQDQVLINDPVEESIKPPSLERNSEGKPLIGENDDKTLLSTLEENNEQHLWLKEITPDSFEEILSILDENSEQHPTIHDHAGDSLDDTFRSTAVENNAQTVMIQDVVVVGAVDEELLSTMGENDEQRLLMKETTDDTLDDSFRSTVEEDDERQFLMQDTLHDCKEESLLTTLEGNDQQQMLVQEEII